MISRRLILVFLMLPITNASAFDACDRNGFEKVEIGWIRSVSVNHKIYVDFKVNIDELEENGLGVSSDVAPALAKDAASTAYYRLYKSVNPPSSSNVDLVYMNTESFLSSCWLKKTYGFRTPLSTFQWVETNVGDGNDHLPPVRELLKRKQLIY